LSVSNILIILIIIVRRVSVSEQKADAATKIAPKPTKITTAIVLRQVDTLLFEAVELTLSGGKVIEERLLTRGPDSLAIALSKATNALRLSVRPSK
jgi:hypothetical protein